MKIVIIGAGRIGVQLTERLAAENHDVTVIDNCSDRLSYVSNNYDVMTILGNGADYYIQTRAEVADADLLICVTKDDAVNMISCLTAKKLGVKNTVARVRTMEYFRQMVFLKDELGLSLVFNPDKLTADEISRILRFPSADNVNFFANGKAEIVEFTVPEGSMLDGLPLSRLGAKFGAGVLLCAAMKNGAVLIPKGDYIIERGDTLFVVGAHGAVSAFFKDTGMYRKSGNSTVILGGSRISLYLANELINVGLRVKIIEQDEAHCIELKKHLRKADIVCADGTNPNILDEEGITEADSFVALTGSDQNNIITSIFASRSGVPKVITKVNEDHFRHMISSPTREVYITPKNIAADFIIQYVRGMQNTLGVSGIESMHEIANGKAEALEFQIGESGPNTDTPLKALRMRSDTLLAAIIRDGGCIIPRGDDRVLPGDTVIAVTTKFGMQRFDDLFEN